VHRIHNPRLWEEYQSEKSRILALIRHHGEPPFKHAEHKINFQTTMRDLPTLDHELNEAYLLHAASYKAIDAIRNYGFEPKKSFRGLFGAGSYFAEDMTKADQYIDPKDETIYVFLARVCMGRPDITTEPCPDRREPRGYPEDFHSTVGEKMRNNTKIRRFREFVIYERRQAYPEFILSLRRKRHLELVGSPTPPPTALLLSNAVLFTLSHSIHHILLAVTKNPVINVILLLAPKKNNFETCPPNGYSGFILSPS
jgi:hypothetical protein